MTKRAKAGRRSRFTDEQKVEALAMIDRGDLTAKQVAESLGVTTRAIQKWRVQLQADERATPLTAAERRRLNELERENRELRLQLEIQKKFHTFSRKRRA